MTMSCALSHLSLPAHHSACSAGLRLAGGLDFDRLSLNWASVMQGLAAMLPPRLRRKPSRRVLDHLPEREQRLLVERAADELQAERQPLRRKTSRDGNAGQARHVHRHGEYFVEIHLYPIRPALLADAQAAPPRPPPPHAPHP